MLLKVHLGFIFLYFVTLNLKCTETLIFRYKGVVFIVVVRIIYKQMNMILHVFVAVFNIVGKGKTKSYLWK